MSGLGGIWLWGPETWVLDGPGAVGIGGVAVERVTKAASERRFVYVPFGRAIRESVISGVSASVLLGDVELLDQESVGGAATARVLVSAGTPGTTSVVRVTAETGQDGELVVYEFEVAVSE